MEIETVYQIRTTKPYWVFFSTHAYINLFTRHDYVPPLESTVGFGKRRFTVTEIDQSFDENETGSLTVVVTMDELQPVE